MWLKFCNHRGLLEPEIANFVFAIVPLSSLFQSGYRPREFVSQKLKTFKYRIYDSDHTGFRFEKILLMHTLRSIFLIIMYRLQIVP